MICEEIKCVIMWNRVKYFFENWNESCMSGFVRVTGFGISLKQREKKNYTKNASAYHHRRF